MTRIVHMRRDLRQPLAVPVWPEGVGLRPFSVSDAPMVHALMEQSYAHGGGTVAPFEQWWTALSNDPDYDPALCFVAWAEDHPVGVAQCWTSAFVKDLCVHPAWQGRGLGRALLLVAFRNIRNRGAKFVDLKVHADNAAAIRVYQYLAMAPVSD